eukprot:Skav211764  [mRNA]  locus=scaffold674:307031:312699:+ [translate_table: standard]
MRGADVGQSSSIEKCVVKLWKSPHSAVDTMPWRLFLLAALGVALSYLGGLLFPSPPVCLDAAVAEISRDFERQIANAKPGLRVTSKGEMLRDRDTFFWSLFTDHFGSNPNTPYMWLALPAFGFFLPSPMWHMKRQDI